jgi:NADH-quinone oxidoreductase subunit M
MTALDTLFTVSCATLLASLLFGRLRLAGPLLLVLYGFQFWALHRMDIVFGDTVFSSLRITILVDQTMSWRYNAVSWFFASLAIGAAFVSTLYASGDWLHKQVAIGKSAWSLHVALAASVLSMVLLLGAADFLTLFLGLELVGWSGFLLMAIPGGIAATAALRYLVYAFTGAMAILGAIALIYTHVGSLEYGRVIDAMPSMSHGQGWALLLLMGGGFAVKMGLLPFHLWQAQAYAEAPAPGSVFLGAVFARMGFYDFLAIFISMLGIAHLAQLEVPFTDLDSQELLAWLAALTIALPSYVALKQQDIRYLLTWVGVGQGGFMLLGLMRGDAAGTAGGLAYVFSFAVAQAAMLMAAFAIVHRTGRSDLGGLRGLARRMPLTFAVLLLGAFSVAGLPPTAGFFAKWLIYRSLLADGMSLLFLATAIGTLGSILALSKLITSLLPERSREPGATQEAPSSMLLPMALLSGISVLIGFMPGPLLIRIAAIQAQLGLPQMELYPGGITHLGRDANAPWLIGMPLSALVLTALALYVLRHHTRYREPGAGQAVPKLIRLISPLFHVPFVALESAVTRVVRSVTRGASWVYRYEQPSLFLLAVALAVTLWAL